MNFSLKVQNDNTYWMYWYNYPNTWYQNWNAPYIKLNQASSGNTPIIISASGSIDGDPYTHSDGSGFHKHPTNAAGINLPGSLAEHIVGKTSSSPYLNLPNGFILPNSGPMPYGSLLVGNPDIGWKQVFLPTQQNGLDSSNPQTILQTTITPNSLFGTQLTVDTKLYFTYLDTDNSNLGSYSLDLSIADGLLKIT